MSASATQGGHNNYATMLLVYRSTVVYGHRFTEFRPTIGWTKLATLGTIMFGLLIGEFQRTGIRLVGTGKSRLKNSKLAKI